MIVLNRDEVRAISGGGGDNYTVQVTIKVPTQDEFLIKNLFTQYFFRQLDANTLSNAISQNPTHFSEMRIRKVTIDFPDI